MSNPIIRHHHLHHYGKTNHNITISLMAYSEVLEPCHVPRTTVQSVVTVGNTTIFAPHPEGMDCTNPIARRAFVTCWCARTNTIPCVATAMRNIPTRVKPQEREDWTRNAKKVPVLKHVRPCMTPSVAMTTRINIAIGAKRPWCYTQMRQGCASRALVQKCYPVRLKKENSRYGSVVMTTRNLKVNVTPHKMGLTACIVLREVVRLRHRCRLSQQQQQHYHLLPHYPPLIVPQSLIRSAAMNHLNIPIFAKPFGMGWISRAALLGSVLERYTLFYRHFTFFR